LQGLEIGERDGKKTRRGARKEAAKTPKSMGKEVPAHGDASRGRPVGQRESMEKNHAREKLASWA